MTIYDTRYGEPAGSHGEHVTRSGDIGSPGIANRERLQRSLDASRRPSDAAA